MSTRAELTHGCISTKWLCGLYKVTPSFDLTCPAHAYLFGLLQADGHLSRSEGNRGRVSLELQAGDKELLERLQSLLLPMKSTIRMRQRDTNYSKAHCSAVWTFYDQTLRATLNSLGLPYGSKAHDIGPPTTPFSEADYYRGIVDGDGSLGITGGGFPFLSLTTKSAHLAAAYLSVVLRVTGKSKVARPNTRDSMYNVCVYKEDAQAMADFLYPLFGICLERKGVEALRVLAWTRPSNMVRVTWDRRKWSPGEDAVLCSMPVVEAARILGRTERSIRVRVSRLRCRRTSRTQKVEAD